MRRSALISADNLQVRPQLARPGGKVFAMVAMATRSNTRWWT